MIDVLIVFAPKDHVLLTELEDHLKPLVLERLITIWHERKLVGGMDIVQETAKHWNTSSIILLLLSSNFMASDACYLKGLDAIAKSKEVQVVPILLKEVDWELSAFGKLIPLPKNCKAITSWHDKDAAYRDIAKGLREIIAELLAPAETNAPTPSTSVASNPNKEPAMPSNIANKLFDVFLSYNSKDRPEVKEIANQLKARGIKPWLDEWELRPGLSWQDALEKQIENIHAAAVFVGQEGIGPWQRMEMKAYLRKFVDRESPVVPVLLKDAPQKPSLPTFLQDATYVDFRKTGQDMSPIDRLIWGITGHNPANDDQDASVSHANKVMSPNVTTQTSGGGNAVGNQGERPLSAAEMRQFVDWLLACPIMQDRHSRDAVVQQLSDKISQGISRNPIDKVDVMNIARTCSYFSNGRQELVDAISWIEGDSIPVQRLREFVQRLQ